MEKLKGVAAAQVLVRYRYRTSVADKIGNNNILISTTSQIIDSIERKPICPVTVVLQLVLEPSFSLIEGAGGPTKKFVSDDVDLAVISDLL